MVFTDVRNCYQKGSLFCVMSYNGSISKFPLRHIFRIIQKPPTDRPDKVVNSGVFVQLDSQAIPIIYTNVHSTYQKGDLFCIMLHNNEVHKFPIEHIYKIIDEPAAP